MYVGRAPRALLVSTRQTSLGDYSTNSAAPVRLENIPSGTGGMIATLKVMRDFARSSIRNPDQIIRAKARDLIGDIPPRQYMKEIRALHSFVRDQIRYTKDPVGLELVQTPEKTLEFGMGDCDDKATLLAALLMATGHPAQFVAVGFGNSGFSHVLVETQVGRGWMPLETIIPVDAGWFPDDVTRAYRLKV